MNNVAIYSVSLCAGGGGLDLGLDLACPGAFTPVLYSERECFAAAVLAARMEEGSLPSAPVWSNVHTLTSPECRDYLREATGGRGVQFVYGGIPCQPHSVAGQQRGADDPRDLWPATLRFIEANPSVELVFIENVPGMLATGGARRIVEDLERLDFRCALGLFTASEVGAPHKRERLFILAHAHSRQREQSRGQGQDARRGGPGVADPSGAQGRRDEPKRGPQGRAAAGRAGEDVGHTASDDERRDTVSGTHRQGITAGGPGGGNELADAEPDGSQGREPAGGAAPEISNTQTHWSVVPE